MIKYTQRNIPAPSTPEYFALSNFHGGLNNKKGYIELDENESLNMLNVDVFKEEGVIWQRGGTEYKDAVDIINPVTFLDEFKKDVSSIIRASDTEIYEDSLKIADVNGRVDGITFNDEYMFVDSTGIYFYGSFPQVADTYTTIIGTPTASYTVMRLEGSQAGYTPLAAPEIIGETVYDYDNNKIYYNPCDYEIDDEFKGSNFVPQSPTIITDKEGRAYVSGSSDLPYTIFLSDIRNPYYFPVSLGLQLTPNGNKIVGMAEFHDTIVVGTKYTLHGIYGNTNRTDYDSDLYTISDLNSHTGFANKNAITRVYNYLYFLGSDGNIYSLYTPQTFTENIMTKNMMQDKINIFEEPLNLSESDYEDSFSIFYKDYFYLSIGDIVLVYSYTYQAWQVYSNWNAKSFLVSDYELLFGNNTGRLVKYVEDIPNDLDGAITCYWQSKRFDMSYPTMFKNFFDMYIVVHTFDDFVSTVNVDIEVDYRSSENVFSVASKVSRWGEAVFGEQLITSNINQSLLNILSKRGRLISFKVGKENVDEKMRVYEINGRYITKNFRR